MTGHSDSNAPVCIAAAASRPGARKSRYDTDSTSSTSDPSPRPIAARNRTGLTTVVNTEPRHVLR
jgi:hypothetical protein